MSAAEKLRALQQPLDEFHISGPYYEAMAHLVRVHPQIVAVVEAAEKIRGDVPWSTGAEVHNALAALEDALA